MKVTFKKLDCIATAYDEKSVEFYLAIGSGSADGFWEGEVKAGESTEIDMALECPDNAVLEISLGRHFSTSSGRKDGSQLTLIFVYGNVRGEKTQNFSDASGRKGVIHYAIEA